MPNTPNNAAPLYQSDGWSSIYPLKNVKVQIAVPPASDDKKSLQGTYMHPTQFSAVTPSMNKTANHEVSAAQRSDHDATNFVDGTTTMYLSVTMGRCRLGSDNANKQACQKSDYVEDKHHYFTSLSTVPLEFNLYMPVTVLTSISQSNPEHCHNRTQVSVIKDVKRTMEASCTESLLMWRSLCTAEEIRRGSSYQSIKTAHEASTEDAIQYVELLQSVLRRDDLSADGALDNADMSGVHISWLPNPISLVGSRPIDALAPTTIRLEFRVSALACGTSDCEKPTAASVSVATLHLSLAATTTQLSSFSPYITVNGRPDPTSVVPGLLRHMSRLSGLGASTEEMLWMSRSREAAALKLLRRTNAESLAHENNLYESFLCLINSKKRKCRELRASLRDAELKTDLYKSEVADLKEEIQRLKKVLQRKENVADECTAKRSRADCDEEIRHNMTKKHTCPGQKIPGTDTGASRVTNETTFLAVQTPEKTSEKNPASVAADSAEDLLAFEM